MLRSSYKIYRSVFGAIITLIMVFLSACGQSSEDNKDLTEKSTSGYTEEELSAETTNYTSTDETSTVEQTEQNQTTTTDSSTVATTLDETTTQQETTKKQETNTKKNTSTNKTQEKATTEFVENGSNIWKYRSDIYANDPVKSELEQIFWNEYGWSAFSKKKNDEMVVAMVELVYDIMQNNKTDFERERALYEAISLTCSYDHESLETGLTPEGQTAYGVLIEHKAVCGGYASTFHIALSMMGIENDLITGMTTEGLHAWNQVCLDDEWYQVDVTWGDSDSDDPEYAFSYNYFNRTSEDMADTHDVRGNNCTGTKYNQEYLEKMYKDEYLSDKVYVKTVDECMSYIARQVENGNDDIRLCVPNEIIDEIRDVVSLDHEAFATRLSLSDDVKKKYYGFDFGWYNPEYMHIQLLSIAEIHICFKVNEYRLKDNFFETNEEAAAYIDEQNTLGAKEILLYYIIEPFMVYIPEAPEGMEWTIVESGIVDGVGRYNSLNDTWTCYLKMQCVEKE